MTRLRQYAEARALQAQQKGTLGPVRAWALLDTLLSSGLRASEAASLRVGDCLLGYGQASLVVRQGKGEKSREGLHPGRSQTPSEGLLDMEGGPWRGPLG